MQYWHWLLAGLFLIALTPLAPLAIVIWVALAALLVGIILLVLPEIGIGVQIVLFLALAVAVGLGWLLLRHGTVGGSPHHR